MLKDSRNHTKDAKQFARKLRREMSVSEKVLWQFLRKDRLGFRFRRQLAVGPWTLDFYCAEARLCVEVDGEQHEESKEKDFERDIDLVRRGILTLRIPSLDLFEQSGKMREYWLNKILEQCHKRAGPPPPTPSSISELFS